MNAFVPLRNKHCLILQSNMNKSLHYGINLWVLASSNSCDVSKVEVYPWDINMFGDEDSGRASRHDISHRRG